MVLSLGGLIDVVERSLSALRLSLEADTIARIQGFGGFDMMNIQGKLVVATWFLTLSACTPLSHRSTTPSSNGNSAAPANAQNNGAPQQLAVNPGAVSGPRTYCVWADPAAERAQQVLVQMGYQDAHFAEDDTRVFTLPPRDGYSLQVELSNLIGSTRIEARADSNSQPAQSAIAEFYSRFEYNLHQDQCQN
ncbi:MAG: hypothetical protein IPK60_15425 [Sandaracinaceae bacterium]|nr:hypothetical protein [Sandaracinaceae bacterium]